MNSELPKYGIILLGLFMYFTAPEYTTKTLGGFFMLAGLMLLFAPFRGMKK